ncbi:glycoside hydrolase 15-like protein [Halogeometricum pallidum JCM 14848]|uniref:Glycoside hydrolase 15-like protein n=1 Tax=Halogeometricum pallidum JCM 14848 TaxID=1227487 RepID=M0DGD4_HALPD|nr:glycoside hydrolase family 15 protein [Halogeometricum pallidum]ELZ33873.1 glycoside hydrolase 15-like protein [Halogeometricum pallidum JCM 14848]
MDGLHPPSDKDALLSSPREDGGYVLTTVNQYPSSAVGEDWRGALIEETSAFRADVEQFGDFHTLLWDADREQTLDVREDAADSDVSYESPRVPEAHVDNEFAFEDGAEASLSQDVLVSLDRPALLVRNRVSFEEGGERTIFSVLNSSIQSGGEESADDETANAMYERSLTSLKCAQDPSGGTIAGAFEPDDQGYRFVWPRDQVFIVAAMLAGDAVEEARRALSWLDGKQITDDVVDDRDISREGTWWQNYRSDGDPNWTALQLDQVGGPIYAHWLLWKETDEDEDALEEHYGMSESAAEFLLGYDNGDGFPGKSQDPWEEVWGHSTEGSAASIAGLRAMAEMAEARGDDGFADDCRETAATWAERFNDYCFREDAYLGDHYVTADSPEGDDSVAPDERPDAAAFMATWPWNVVDADSDEMRSTVELATDPAWCADDAACVGRYPEDDFTPSGSVEDGGWPICEAFADAVRWLDGDGDALRKYVFEDAPTWTSATGLLPEQIRGDGSVRWNCNLQWSQAMYVLLAESHARGEPFGMAPGADAA